jgi:Cortical protein marker for cell polarity
VGDDVIVNTIAAQPDTSGVYVGGSFDSTSQGLSCSCVCMYDTSTSQWNTVGSGLGGEVRALYWNDKNQLFAAGDMTVSNNATSLAIYDAKDQTWSVMPVSGIPQGVTTFAQATNRADQMWVGGTAANGTAFVVKIDDSNALPVSGLLGSGTTIRGLQVMTLGSDHGKTDYLERRDALLVTGQLNITNFGMASAALFNGTTMNPLVLSSKANGSPGSISQLVSQNPNRRGSSSEFPSCPSLNTPNKTQEEVTPEALLC